MVATLPTLSTPSTPISCQVSKAGTGGLDVALHTHTKAVGLAALPVPSAGDFVEVPAGMLWLGLLTSDGGGLTELLATGSHRAGTGNNCGEASFVESREERREEWVQRVRKPCGSKD